MSVETVPTLEVNGVTADFAAETLRDRAGNSVALRPQAFAVLRHLAANPDRLVTKDELMAAVWPDTAVTDDSLVQCIHDIRRALRDDGHAVLRTVPRRGYRLVPPCASRPPPAVGAVHNLRRPAAAAGATALLAAVVLAWWLTGRGGEADWSDGGRPVVAVQGFVDVADDPVSRMLALSLKKNLYNDLAQFREFDLVLRQPAFAYAGSADPLRADFAVGGSIQREAGRLRIQAQLFDANTGGLLWSERWDRPDADFLQVLTEISERTANRLGGGAGLIQEAGRIAAHRKRPQDRTPYDLYLLGTQRLEQLTRPDVEAAVGLLERAVELQPAMARAWVELYHSHILLHFMGVDPERNLAVATAAAERALALDPSDAEAHAVVGMSRAVAGDLARARAELDAALTLAPSAAEILTFYSYWAASFGEPERGAAMVDRVLRIEPAFPNWKAWAFAHAYFSAGRYEDALAMLERLAPENYNTVTWALRPAALAALGRHAEAAVWLARARAADPDLTIERMANWPGHADAQRRRLVETMRLARFPPCATPEALAGTANPIRLPECAPRAGLRP